jgi:hypothetical protein
MNNIFFLYDLISRIQNESKISFPNLESLLVELIELSVTPEEGRFPKVIVQVFDKKIFPQYLVLKAGIKELGKIAQPFSYPNFAIECRWQNNEWNITGINSSRLGIENVLSLIVAGPLDIRIALPNHRGPTIQILRGKIIELEGEPTEILQKVGATAIPNDREGFGYIREEILESAVYKLSRRGRGGTILLLPPHRQKAEKELAFGHRAKLGRSYELLSAQSGYPNNQEIDKYENLIAAMASIDGAVVFTHDLLLLGFGATILTSFSRQAKALQKGHRQKSAFAFCQKFSKSVAIVISQDGPITAYGDLPMPKGMILRK